MQLSAKAAGTLPRCSSPAHDPHTRSHRAASLLLLSQILPSSLSSSTFFIDPQAPTHVCSPCVWGAAVGMGGEGCGWFSCCLHGGDQLFLALFLNGMQQAHIRACRSSCLDEYLPKSLRYLAVSLQKGPAPFVW